MFNEFVKKASELHANDQPFAIATVVRCEPPTSGKPGDRAIISADGTITGWIGGGCAQPVVIKESQKALRDGKARLIRVSPTAGAEPSDGITGYTMMCHSGGTLDIFIEPVLPKPHLMIFGRSPVAQILEALAKVLSYRIGDKPTADSAIIIATQGEDDEGALEQALNMEASYIAFVASTKKWEAVAAYLREKGFSDDRLQNVKVPAGLDIGAGTPEEIAVSILAEIIQVRRKSISAQAAKAPEAVQAIDPVCGMTVNVATAKYSTEHARQKYYFCCAPCKTKFEKNPQQFLQANP